MKLHFDLVFEQFSTQNNLQVFAALQVLIPYIKKFYPQIQELNLLSDNASCFASHDGIPFFHYLNQKLTQSYHPPQIPIKVRRWMYTEASTGKDEEDTHFSFINTLFHSYVLDGNNILTEKDMFMALTFSGGIKSSHVILIDAKELDEHNHIYKKGRRKRRKLSKEKLKLEQHIIFFLPKTIAHLLIFLKYPIYCSRGHQ